jgi:hypothetical protein
VPRAVYEHAVICEYAHALLRGAVAADRPAGLAGAPAPIHPHGDAGPTPAVGGA